MFKVKNKDTRTTTVNFEQVNTGWHNTRANVKSNKSHCENEV